MDIYDTSDHNVISLTINSFKWFISWEYTKINAILTVLKFLKWNSVYNNTAHHSHGMESMVRGLEII